MMFPPLGADFAGFGYHFRGTDRNAPERAQAMPAGAGETDNPRIPGSRQFLLRNSYLRKSTGCELFGPLITHLGSEHSTSWAIASSTHQEKQS
jgi:hypothetical protein